MQKGIAKKLVATEQQEICSLKTALSQDHWGSGSNNDPLPLFFGKFRFKKGLFFPQGKQQPHHTTKPQASKLAA
jgi:hypothetical protein